MQFSQVPLRTSEFRGQSVEISMRNRSSKNELQHSLTFARHKRASYRALIWPRVDLISLMWYIWCNMILVMNQSITFTELIVPHVRIKAKEAHCCSYYQKN